ncbi:uncharacterized protein LOC126908405 [Daktulosphaira vitifoliae]|uniref:uncharacterized protein LOC126908405 n=1 Tax=Daktulosphaira vitifoliae TaxID=58002 RepID=UPI0021A9BE27|nr:uncharacterized protein LOC126908405 [Daktulosphaira vitifoliae]
MILTKIILLLLIHLILGLYFNKLHCNFIKYMLNFFNHNNRYLTEISENIEKYDVLSLNKYGDAIKTHGEISLVMLYVLRETNKSLYSKELMSVNLYLNNVSEYVNFNGKNDDGIFDLSDQTSSILKGYTILHDFFLDQFEKMTNKVCNNVEYDEVFIYCPDYNESGEYTPESFQYVAKKLKNRLLQTDKQQNDTDDNIKNLEHSEVYFVFNKAIKMSQYWGFLPKNVLLYDLMMHNSENPEKDLMKSSNDEQNLNSRNEYALDLIRFAPLIKNCPDKSEFTLFDIFRYVKYSFYNIDVQIFHTLILTATFRPIALLVRLFIKILSSSIYQYDFHSYQEEPLKFYKHIISVGERIIECFQNFVNMNLFGDDPTDVFFILSKETFQCLKHFIHKNYQLLVLSSKTLMNSIKSFLYKNNFDIIVLTGYYTKSNIDDRLDELVINLKQVEQFVTELKSHRELFEVMKKNFNIDHRLNIQNSYIFNESIISKLCQIKHNNTLLFQFKNDDFKKIGDIKGKNTADDDENRNKIIRQQNHFQENIKNNYRSNDYKPYPIYLVNYILNTKNV